MNRRLLNVLMALLTATVFLAGCSDGGGGDADPDDGAIEGRADGELQAGKGAINGLLVDDRYRPIDLTDDPTTEFQAQGFVLLQETGQQVKSNENGEFTFVDLEPGEYTLRVTAEGHEATPKKVVVEEGLFAEATVIARRIVSQGSLIITEEYSGFTPCSAATPVGLVTFNCLDASGESYRPGPDGLNYTGLEDLTYMVVEMKVSQAGNYMLEVRNAGDNLGTGPSYASASTDGSDYVKAIVQPYEIYDESVNSDPWDYRNQTLSIVGFYEGEDEAQGSGAQTWVRTTFLVSLFVGEPEVDLESYQLQSAEA